MRLWAWVAVVLLAAASAGCGKSSCDANSCSGCCDSAGKCQVPSEATCGVNGVACAACTGDDHCAAAGVCQTQVSSSSSTSASSAASSTGTGGSSSSTGTTGTASSSSSTGGSSGGSTGGAGQSDTDCSPAHHVCSAGQHCLDITNNGAAHYACSCTLAGSAQGDSCANNTDGNVVCDDYTDRCRPPRDFEACNTADCDTGYICAHITGAEFNDGGPVYECEKTCQSPSDCTEVITTCVPDAITNPFPDGGVGTEGACHKNYCGPNTPLNDGGSFDAGAYYDVCDAAGTGDGVCVARLTSGGSDYGYCYRPGAALIGHTCGNNDLDNDFCVLGALCLYTSDPDAPAFCAPACDAQGTSLGTCPSGLHCSAFQSGISTSPDPGFCH